MKKIKKIFNYLIYLLPWFIGALLFPSDNIYYKSLNLPFFAPPSWLFPVAWTIIYILIAYSLYKTINKSNTKYKIYLYINYLFNQLYTFFFFKLKSPLLGLLDTVIILISAILLFKEIYKIDKKSSLPFLAYIGWIIFATVLGISIFILN